MSLPKTLFCDVWRGWNCEEAMQNILSAWHQDHSILMLNPGLLAINALKTELKRIGVDLADSGRVDPRFILGLGEGFHVLLSTSGSTGQPQWFALDRKSVLWNTRTLKEHLNLDANMTFYLHVPLFHAFGLVLTFMQATLLQAPLRCFRQFHVPSFLDCLEEDAKGRRPVFLPFVPRHLELLASLPAKKRLRIRSLRLSGVSVVGGDAVFQHHLATLHELFPHMRHTVGYGCTQAGPALFHTNPLADRLQGLTIGSPLPQVRVHQGEQQELLFQSPGQACAKLEHWGQPSPQWSHLKGTWLPTGDRVQIADSTESSPTFVYRGRVGDMARKKSGEWFSLTLLQKELSQRLNTDLSLSFQNSKGLEILIHLQADQQKGACYEVTEQAVKAAIEKLPPFFQPNSWKLSFDRSPKANETTSTWKHV